MLGIHDRTCVSLSSALFTSMRVVACAYLLLTVANARASKAYATTIIVPGDANPWLAGMPNGAVAGSGFDSAPAQSPIFLAAAADEEFSFSATGLVSHGDDDPTGYGPAGDVNFVVSNDNGPENGIANVNAPIDALIGVFLDSSFPNSLPAPATLDFSTEAERDFLSLSPELRQPFYIGDGLTSESIVLQSFIAPAGATRLFLGTMDGYGWFNNTGSFTVTIPTPEPSTFLLGAIAGAALIFVRKQVSGCP